MTTIHQLAAYRDIKPQIRPSDVVGALTALGGAAHRDAIVRRVASSLPAPLPQGEVRQAVDTILRHRNTGRFRQVFGPDSYRWALASTSDAWPPA